MSANFVMTIVPKHRRWSVAALVIAAAAGAGAAEPRLAQWDFSQPATVAARQSALRQKLSDRLGISREKVPLDSEFRGAFEHGDVRIEKWIFTSEAGSRIPALLYRPARGGNAVPAIVLTHGHGASKSTWAMAYAGLLYARLGVACLAADPLGEEERNATGRMGSRAHDAPDVSERIARTQRTLMGKFVFDTMRGIDFAQSLDYIDGRRIGVAGESLGGAVASWTAGLDERVTLALVAGWAFAEQNSVRGKLCTRIPFAIMREECYWPEFIGLAAPHCSMLVMNGTADSVLDSGDGSAWEETRKSIGSASTWFERLGGNSEVAAWFEPSGGHRPYHLYREALRWIHRYLGTPLSDARQIEEMRVQNAGRWLDHHGIELEKLYGTALHWRGATLPEHGLSPLKREDLAVLRPAEIGDDQYTLEGWLKVIEAVGRR